MTDHTIVTAWVRVGVIVPTDHADSAHNIIDSYIEHGSFRDGLDLAFDGAGVPMVIDTVTVPEQDTLVAVATGNPVDGLAFYGPAVTNTTQIEHLTDRHLSSSSEWWYCPLAPLPAEPIDAATLADMLVYEDD